MEWVAYGLLFLLALLISASAIYAFSWAHRTGQFRNLEAQSRSIFDESEPEGRVTDFFPGRAPAAPAAPAPADPHPSS